MKYTLAIFTIIIIFSIAACREKDKNINSIPKLIPNEIPNPNIPTFWNKQTVKTNTQTNLSTKPKTNLATKPQTNLATKPQLPKRSTTTTKSKQDIVVVEESSNVATLVEYPITATSSISYYYPYFVKTNLVTFVDEVDVSVLSTNCTNGGCRYCDSINPTICQKCHTGFFLFNDSCSTICPGGYFADNLRGKCVAAVSSVEIVYTVAYSIGSCLNACGLPRIDCDCDPSCRFKGTCCTDFNLFGCPEVVSVLLLRKKQDSEDECGKKNVGCKYCDQKITIDSKENIKKCVLCKEDYFLYEGRCFEKCPDQTIANYTNKTCEKKPLCDIQNCGECANSTTCKTCKNGYFKFGNECNSRCPVNYRADRITWTCLEPPVFAWYWVYPSRSSCQNYCGIVIQKDWDCSCSADCFYFGNCCQDIDYYCDALLFWRKKEPKKPTNRLRESPKKITTEKTENKPNPALPMANSDKITLPLITPKAKKVVEAKTIETKKPEIKKIKSKKNNNKAANTITTTDKNTAKTETLINKNVINEENIKPVEKKVEKEEVKSIEKKNKVAFRTIATNTASDAVDEIDSASEEDNNNDNFEDNNSDQNIETDAENLDENNEDQIENENTEEN